MKKKRVAILGFMDSWKRAPWEDYDYEIWCMNHFEVYSIPRYDRWFDMHTWYNLMTRDIKNVLRKRRKVDSHIHWLNKHCDVPIYMPKKYDAIEGSVAYPIEKMLKIHGPVFTNSVDYEIALAIEEGFKEIQIYGIAMAGIDEIWQQRNSLSYFVGYAKGKGVDVYIPSNHNFLRINQIYGYNTKNIEPYWKYLNSNQTM